MIRSRRGHGGDLRACRQVIRVHARSFSFASHFLPREVRSDVAVVYAFYRLLDDLVDDPPAGVGRSDVRAVLDEWDGWLASPLERRGDAAAAAAADGPGARTSPGLEPAAGSGAPPSPGLAPASDRIRRSLAVVIERRGLERSELRIVIRGLRRDLDHARPATLADLEAYAFEVAGSVGLVMARLLGAPMPASAAAATAMGSAMQLTNICRDVDEDRRRGRIYLPEDVCAAAGCDDADIAGGRTTPGVRRAVAAVAGRARELYRVGADGLGLLPADARFPIAVAARAYATILDRLAQRDHDVFAGRVAMTGRARWAMAARLAASRAVGRQPV